MPLKKGPPKKALGLKKGPAKPGAFGGAVPAGPGGAPSKSPGGGASQGKAPGWELVQKKTFTRWCNQFLRIRSYEIVDLYADLRDGLALINLLEIITGEEIGRKYCRVPRIWIQQLENCSLAVSFTSARVKLVGIGAENIVDGNPTLILGLIWTIILRFHIQGGGIIGEETRSDELLRWVQKQIPDQNVANLHSSFKDGRAILALLESIRPTSVQLPAAYATPEKNCELAFRLAEEKCDIPRLLDVCDMTQTADDLSNRTYISFYRDYWLRNQDRELELKPAIVAVLNAKRQEAPDCVWGLIRGKAHDYRSHIDEEGTVANCFGTFLGYINLDGDEVASEQQFYLGAVKGDQVYDENDEEVANIDRGTGTVHDALGSTIFQVDATGQCVGQTNVYLGEFLKRGYRDLNTMALYVLFLDPTFAREDIDK